MELILTKLPFRPAPFHFLTQTKLETSTSMVIRHTPNHLVARRAKEIKEKARGVKLYTRDYPFGSFDDDENVNWGCVDLDHPITFDKLATDPSLMRRKEYYNKVGKAWKRGYLLYGPPGTGKSSMVAVMANYLKFDMYDLELTSIYSNSDLRRTLLCTNNKLIVVIEGIDCSVQLHDRREAVITTYWL